MRGKSLALLALALGCGLIASIGITQVMSKRNTGDKAPTGETETIFVALDDIGLGEPLSSPLLRLEQWPKDKVPTGALTKIEDVEGRCTKTKLYAGEPILGNKLHAKGEQGGSVTLLIPKGFRVVSVRVDSVSSSGNLIRHGDRVDVMVHLRRNPGEGFAETMIRTILQDIKVFAVNDVVGLDSEKSNGKPIAAKTISLLVTPEDAELVMLATQMGAIQLVMRSREDDEFRDLGEGTGTSRIADQGDPHDRADEDPLAKAASAEGEGEKGNGFLDFLKQAKNTVKPQAADPAKPAGSDQFEMRMISGPEVSILVLESEGNQPGSAVGDGFWRVNAAGSGSVLDGGGVDDDMDDFDYEQEEPGEEENGEEENGEEENGEEENIIEGN